MNNKLGATRETTLARDTDPSVGIDGAAAPHTTVGRETQMPSLDMHALQRMSQTMAAEVTPNTRVRTLLHGAMESTEATWGLLAVCHNGHWEAAASARPSGSPQTCGKPWDNDDPPAPDMLPTSILCHAANQLDGFVLHDAWSAPQWQIDAYVRCCQPRSVLCVPMRCNGKLVGAMYLEHQSIAGLFTPSRTAVVEIIALQAGLALEHARLHDALSAQLEQLSCTEEKMRQTLSELERATRLKGLGELVASIVHEVAQPVTALDSSARAGLRWLDSNTPNVDAAREMFAHISACASRARTIISGLRANARQAEPVFTTFDLDEVLTEVATILTSTLDAMKVSFQLIQLSGPTPVHGERMQLQQALINLIINGAESMADQPEDTRLVVLSGEAIDDLLHIHIDDNGEGFDPALEHCLFEPLFTTKQNGMGMGLAICKSIVETHQGRLELIHRSEGGTRATLTLPALATSTCAVRLLQ
ncbi:ATP-binding protein [Cupriavidus pauculus]|uniref:GAF domain-containing sensor histidine kinase n=1 Tax=Cupriavidus pauculus TaxID=82633 RepID=UPI001EE2738A|nr:ATP-binding protein [Cupriavidus pauculus]GJG98754.1 GAF domain-containing protein [Cupriavidus pauculus]